MNNIGSLNKYSSFYLPPSLRGIRDGIIDLKMSQVNRIAKEAIIKMVNNKINNYNFTYGELSKKAFNELCGEYVQTLQNQQFDSSLEIPQKFEQQPSRIWTLANRAKQFVEFDCKYILKMMAYNPLITEAALANFVWSYIICPSTQSSEECPERYTFFGGLAFCLGIGIYTNTALAEIQKLAQFLFLEQNRIEKKIEESPELSQNERQIIESIIDNFLKKGRIKNHESIIFKISHHKSQTHSDRIHLKKSGNSYSWELCLKDATFAALVDKKNPGHPLALAVVAHELGHIIYQHGSISPLNFSLVKGILYTQIFFALFSVKGLGYNWYLGRMSPTISGAVFTFFPAFSLTLLPFQFYSFLKKENERQADHFAGKVIDQKSLKIFRKWFLALGFDTSFDKANLMNALSQSQNTYSEELSNWISSIEGDPMGFKQDEEASSKNYFMGFNLDKVDRSKVKEFLVHFNRERDIARGLILLDWFLAKMEGREFPTLPIAKRLSIAIMDWVKSVHNFTHPTDLERFETLTAQYFKRFKNRD